MENNTSLIVTSRSHSHRYMYCIAVVQRFPKRLKVKMFRRMASFGMLLRVALVGTGVSVELSASFIRVARIGEIGTTLAVTSNRRTLPTLADRRVSRGQRSGTPKALKKGVFWDVTPCGSCKN
jgi:hypothetical protein